MGNGYASTLSADNPTPKFHPAMPYSTDELMRMKTGEILAPNVEKYTAEWQKKYTGLDATQAIAKLVQMIDFRKSRIQKIVARGPMHFTTIRAEQVVNYDAEIRAGIDVFEAKYGTDIQIPVSSQEAFDAAIAALEGAIAATMEFDVNAANALHIEYYATSDDVPLDLKHPSFMPGDILPEDIAEQSAAFRKKLKGDNTALYVGIGALVVGVLLLK
jgi:hypothetical protein